ncbi:MAG: cytochrome C oxidase subunit IV family protein [Chloroflexi bacterium]|nr:cytochrome C oxidase subunit IV family protein [Chloroflexota bacterium]
MKKKKANALQLGITVLIGLAVLTLVEYGVSFLETPTIALFILALFKAGLIMNYFMHIGLLWSGEDKH